jgi:hypothetical protein
MQNETQLRYKLIRTAHANPGPVRAAILEIIQDFDKTAETKLRGWSGFTDQMRALNAAKDEVAKRKAEITALVPADVLKAKSDAEKELKKHQKQFTDDYKEHCDDLGDVIIAQSTKLTECEARIKVAAVKRTLTQVEAEVLAAVAEKYGHEIAGFIATVTSTLRDQEKTLRVTHKGFELENRVASLNPGARTAGLLDKLTQFRGWFEKTWKKMSAMLAGGLRMVMGDAKQADKAYSELDKALKAHKA